MWQVVCVGPGPMDRVRRIHDRGPLHHDKGRANSFAKFLQSTGLYESVRVEESTLKEAAVAPPPALSFKPRDTPAKPASSKADRTLDELSSMLEELPAADPASREASDAG